MEELENLKTLISKFIGLSPVTWIGDSFGRDKGTRRIGDKCGNQVKFVNCE